MPKKPANQLKPGDVIPPPAPERKWLWRDGTKRLLTVIEVTEGRVDKRGLWLSVKASFASPYSDKVSEMVIDLRPETEVNAN